MRGKIETCRQSPDPAPSQAPADHASEAHARDEMWRFALYGPGGAFINMALDEALLIHCIEGVSPPTVRFYEWDKASISIGYAVDAEKELNLSLCQERDVPIVRRVTGGGIVFHKCDITYTVIFPEDFGCGERERSGKTLSVLESYRLVNRALAEGLRELGVSTSLLERDERRRSKGQPVENVCFGNPTVYDILHNGRKLAGNAQRRKKGWVLHQGSMLFSSDFITMYELVRGVGRADSPAGYAMVTTAVCLEEILGFRPDRSRVVLALRENFAKVLGIGLEPASLSKSETEMAERLRTEKYSTDDWNLKRSVRPNV